MEEDKKLPWQQDDYTFPEEAELDVDLSDWYSVVSNTKFQSQIAKSFSRKSKHQKGLQNLSCFFKEKRLQREVATLSVIRLGLEPKTPTLKVLCSTSWASGSTLLLLSGCKDRNSFSYRQAFSIFFSGNVQKTFEWGSVCLPINSRLPSVCLPFAFRLPSDKFPFGFR